MEKSRCFSLFLCKSYFIMNIQGVVEMIIDYAKKCEKTMMISSILTFLLGLILLIEPVGSIRMMTCVIGIISLLIGVFQLIDYIRQSKEEKMMSLSLFLSVFFLSGGLFLVLNLDSLVKFITVIIGVTILIKAIFKIQFALNLRDLSDKWRYNLILGLISATIGILLLVNPFKSAVLFLRIIGGILAFSSLIELIENLTVMHSLEEVTELPFEEKKSKKESENE